MDSGKNEWKTRFWENGNVDDQREPSKGKIIGPRYAIWIDLDPASLEDYYVPESGDSAFMVIGREIGKCGFILQRSGTYLGDYTVDAVRSVLAIQTLATNLPWFEHCVRDIKLLRIEEICDLRPAIDLVSKGQKMEKSNA